MPLGLGLLAFIAGYLFYFYGKGVNYTASICVLILGCYLAGAHNDSASYKYLAVVLGAKTYEISNFTSGILIVYSVIFGANINALLSKRLFVFMGKVSFSVYLIHLLLISTIGAYIFNMLLEYYTYDISAITSIISLVFVIYVVSVPFYAMIDRTGMKISNIIPRVLLNGFNSQRSNQELR